jgi:hypothetical protein
MCCIWNTHDHLNMSASSNAVKHVVNEYIMMVENGVFLMADVITCPSV